MKRIALYQQLLAGRPTRGPHVFFPLFNHEYQQADTAAHRLYYIVKTDDVVALRQQYSEGELNANRIIFLKERNHRFKVLHETLDILFVLLRFRISLLHVISYSSSHDPIWTLKILHFLRPIWRIRKTFALTYNGVPTGFKLGYAGHHKEDIKYENLFRRIAFDGIFTWFDDVKEWAETSGVFRKIPIVSTPTSRFCDMQKFFPAQHKEKTMVWAGAFVEYKRPLMFLEALRHISDQQPHLLTGWKVIFIGNGVLEDTIRHFIQSNNLNSLIEIRPAQKNYYQLINTTMLHVSTQSIDHFPNLVINEAMASGCAVIATNVGRAHLFVQHLHNGYLTATDDEPGLRDALVAFLSLTELQRSNMLQNSRTLAETVHTPANFIRSIDQFWTEVMNSPTL
jgi:glycosyltransferase involved in cell wall biosynthesis